MATVDNLVLTEGKNMRNANIDRNRAMREFEKAARNAMGQGISSDVLTERVMELEEVVDNLLAEIGAQS